MTRLSDKNLVLQNNYFRGEISAKEYVESILNTKDGDRKRRRIEEKYISLNGTQDKKAK